MASRSGEFAHRNRWLPLLMALAVALCFCFPLRGMLARYEWAMYDWVMTYLPSARVKTDVVPVLITQQGINQFGRWPWPRAVWSNFLMLCHEYGARAVVFDVLFIERQLQDGGTDDAVLAAWTQEAGNVFYACVFDQERHGGMLHAAAPGSATVEAHARRTALALDRATWPDLALGHDLHLPLPELTQAAAGVGFINVPLPDADGVTRRTRLLTRYGAHVYPSLDLLLTCRLLGVDPKEIVGGPRTGLALRGEQGALPRPVPVDARGEMFVNFVPRGAYQRQAVDFAALWEAGRQLALEEPLTVPGIPDEAALRALIEGKILIVGMGLDGLMDIRAVPNDPHLPMVYLHANVLDNLWHGTFRAPLAHGGEPGGVALVVGLALLIGLMLPRLSYSAGALGLLLLTLGYFAIHVYCASATPYVLPLFVPGATALVSYTLITAYQVRVEDAERRRVRAMWSRYSTPEVVEEVMSDPSKAGLFGQRRKVTVISADIRGFTPQAEQGAPEQAVAMLNNYFGAMAEIVRAHHGTINNYIGDCMMVIFGAPVQRDDDTLRAVQTAWALLEEVKRLQAAGQVPLGIGIGVNTGEAVVGNIGSDQFMSYTVIGDAVNTAFRLESIAAANQIILSQQTYAEVAEFVEVRPLPAVELKGKRDTVEIYALVGFVAGKTFQ